MRRVIAAIFAVTFAFVGPRLAAGGKVDRDAGRPFEYAPPDGFVEEPSNKEGARLWVHPDTRATIPAAVVVHHADKTMRFAPGELERLTAEMPTAFEDCTWVHRRHEVRTREDGARVGLIEGDCTRDVDMKSYGIEGAKLRLRKLQLIFPDDRGVSIATASYSTDEAPRWEPAIEATISKARGVATRHPPPPAWQYAAWAAAGAVVGVVLGSVVTRKKRTA